MLKLIGIEKTYGRVTALSGVNVDVAPGEIVALAGPSGAGKTSTIHIAAGILAPDGGGIRLNGRDITEIPAWKRDVALVQESYALYPHMTVFENIAFPLRSPLAGRDLTDTQIRTRVEAVAEVVEMTGLLASRVQNLSGGQRQRVGLARAMVREPKMFLLDEPIAHLDAKLRHWLRGELRRRITAMGRPCLWATPDGKEALSVADRIAVILDGKVAQLGTPRDVFLRPATARVAEIVSEPPISLIKGRIDPEDHRLHLDGIRTAMNLEVEPGTHVAAGPVIAGVRPADVRMGNGSSRLVTPASVLAREFTTRETVISVRVGEQSVRVAAEPFSDRRVDDAVTLDWEGAKVYLFEAGEEQRLLTQGRIRA
jgi:multiple sugar transport system ATP-binding protein